jgi:hypothetical protein
MKRIFVSLFAVPVLWGVSLAQQPTSPPSTYSTAQQQQAPATTAPEPSTSPTANSPSAQQNGQPAEQTPQAPQQTPQPVPPAAQQNAKSPSGSSPQSASLARIAPGSVIPVELTKSIDAKKVKTGDEVVAKVTMDLKTNSGEIVVPKDTKVVGHVTEAQARSKEQKDSQVGIIFDRAVMKNGGEMQMPMSIQAIIAPQASNSGNANNGDGQATPAPAASGAPSSGGRAPGMGGAPPPAPNASAGSNTSTDDSSTAANAHEPITGKTEGVVGLRDLKLATTAAAASQGSVVSSEKNNVKLESGTFMLLRVNQ